MAYCISGIKNNERVFLGKTTSDHYLFTKNPQFIMHFPTLQDAVGWWNVMLPKFDRRMIEDVSDISSGNINYVSLTWLDKEVEQR